MKQQFALTWAAVMDNRFNPLRYKDLASRHYLAQVLAWMWSMIFSISFLSIHYFSFVWLAHLLAIGGIFITITLVSRARSRREARPPVPMLSRASKCVWQMDREA